MLTVVYDSKTGLGKKFAKKLPYPRQKVKKELEGPCLLVTRNEGLGEVPKKTKKFLKKYSTQVQGVVVNGNKKYGKYFCGSGDRINKKYGLPILRKMEGEGDAEDVKAVLAALRDLGFEAPAEQPQT